MLDNKFVQYSDNDGKNILYKPSKKISVTDIKSTSIQTLIKDMHQKMQSSSGIGIAANQIGEPLQLFMIEFDTDVERYKNLKMEAVPFQVFINPKITKASKEKVTFWHGCLSAANKPRGKVATYEWIEYEALDEKGKLQKGCLNGMAAIIFQHEFRHLLGKCYLDFAKVFLPMEELQKQIKDAKIKAYDKATPDDPLLLADYHVGDTIEQYAAQSL